VLQQLFSKAEEIEFMQQLAEGGRVGRPHGPRLVPQLVNAYSDRGITPLMLAAQCGCLSSVKLLLAKVGIVLYCMSVTVRSWLGLPASGSCKYAGSRLLSTACMITLMSWHACPCRIASASGTAGVYSCRLSMWSASTRCTVVLFNSAMLCVLFCFPAGCRPVGSG
jgi:ankyrin repeat protein